MSLGLSLPCPSLPRPARLACRWVGLSLFLVALVALAGCGGGSGSSKNSISGKVSLNGEAVAGTVGFVGPDGKEVPTPIMADGRYLLNDPPIGQVKVVVKGMAGMTGGLAAPKEGAAIKDAPKTSGGGGAAPPSKYSQASTTPLSTEIKAGKQTYDIPLSP